MNAFDKPLPHPRPLSPRARGGSRVASATFTLNTLACALGLLATFPATAEIVFLEGGRAVSVGSAYVYAHPALHSIVFASPQAREMAILPPSPYFVNYPPLLLRASSPYGAYPPVVYQSGINATARPSNRDVTTYNIGRAHAFSQEYYYPETYANTNQGGPPALYAWPYSVMPYYPPASGTGGFNQPVRPSNRDITTYNIERAHRFSMDAYKSP
ncbi:hypothetical protein [Propionivibrio sp.]|uniref:hypothetical protein n=1 Tax=Propionivibrio sp. TaxID=2212460 RepID=UPI003BEFDF46